jgi:TOMM system kinase/cyclase fusion protein
MTFDEVLDQVRELLQRRGRVTYRALKRRFELDDEYLEDLKGELINAERVAVDEDGKVLVWVGASPVSSSTFQVSGSQPHSQVSSSTFQVSDSKSPTPSTQSLTPNTQTLDSRRQTLDSARPEAERRQLTVQFIDLVDSTALSTRLDPEELREVIQAYRGTCATVIRRFDGHLAKYIGDGLLIYFGYPQAHEDDASRAVRAGLEIAAEIQHLNARLRQTVRALQELPLQVRVGIHTGLVVAGEMGVEEQPEPLAIIGETPNIAARLQAMAAPNTVVISDATQRLVQGLFECQDLGSQELKGLPAPLPLYRVIRESEAQSRFEVAIRRGLTPLVGREHELGLLMERWERAKRVEGQVVLLSGEAGIGKSRLVQEVKEQVTKEGALRWEFRCSPYYQNSAWYPVIDFLQRRLQFSREDTPEEKLAKLEQALSRSRLELQETVPLLAFLLSLPASRYTFPVLTPQRQKQKTQEALVAWLLAEAERQAVYCPWEDLHWADPSTLELLQLLIDQAPTARLYVLLTFRPEFTPPWGTRSQISQLTLSRLGQSQVEEMAEKITGGKTLPPEIVQQIVAKTDGVPLFVEELTKMVMESEAVGARHAVPLPLTIPATLHDSLMARLDRLGPAKEIAQLGATLGREFSYELIHAVSPLDEVMLQKGLSQLVEAELVYQRGLPPQVQYTFKHALIQDVAYQSLLKSTRQQYHQQIVQVLEERFPETKETQPELLAHHCTEAGLVVQAIPYWQQAGKRATQRSAHVEAIRHLTKGLELLKALPDTPERAQQELSLQITLGAPLVATKGWAASEVGKAYTRARELCRQVGETPQLFPVLMGLFRFYLVRAEHKTARELGEQCLSLAQRVQDPVLLVEAHYALGNTLYFSGEFAPAREHLEQGIACYDPLHHRSHALVYGADPGVFCLSWTAHALWFLGYVDQALKRSHEALALAQELSHPFSLALALDYATMLHQFCRGRQAVQELAAAAIALCTEQGFPYYLAWGTVMQGWVLAEQGQREEGSTQMRQSLAALRATGAELRQPYYLAMLAEACGKMAQAEEGLEVLAEAMAAMDKSEERFYEAELYRLKGELTLQKFQVSDSRFQVQESPKSEVKTSLGQVQDKSKTSQDKSEVPNPQSPTSNPQVEAEECFLKAIEIARKQQAKSLELRATMSLVRLRQQQATQDASRTMQPEARTMLNAARNMLSDIYNWFTEGFDTKDLQEAKALLNELA